MRYLIDVSGFIFRAYHALPPLKGPQGEPVGALFGFCSMLLKLLETIPPHAKTLAIFDCSRITFRHSIYPDYKAHRPPPPDDLVPQFEWVRDAVDAFGIPRVQAEGFEADDLMASYAHCDEPVVLVSSDKDLLQLLSDRVRVIDPITYQEKTAHDVMKKFGVSVSCIADALALMGDSSDNVPGVPGIGQKTAAELLNAFGSLDAIYENIEKISQKKRRESLEFYKNQAYMSKRLVELLPIAPTKDIPLNTEAYVEKFLKQWKFDSLLKRYKPSVQKPLKETISLWPPKDEPHGTLYLGSNIKTHLTLPYDDVMLMGVILGEEGTIENYSSLKKSLAQERLVTLYERIERPIGRVLYHMEKIGIRIDQEKLKQAGFYYEQQQHIYQKRIFEKTQKVFNIASPKQLGEVLFEDMKLPPPKKTKTGSYVTDASVLETLSSQGFDIAQDILKWRMYAKLLSSYVEGLKACVSQETGRIHTTFSIASTGRLISEKPNLQTIPIKTPEGRMIKNCFISEDGYELISFDYSQMELRLLAFLGPIPELQEAFLRNEDIHTSTALYLFGEETQENRRIAKTMNFGILYGISPYGLSQQLNISVSEASALIEKYFAHYPSLIAYQDKCRSFAFEHGYIETLFKRRVYVTDNVHKKQFAGRQAINAPLQGSNADILKKAMIFLFKEIEKTPLRMVLSIHDALVFEIPNPLVQEWVPRIQEIMESIVKNIPLKVHWERWH